MSRALSRIVLAGIAVLGITVGSQSAAPPVAMAATEAADAPLPESQAGWQQQWNLLLRQEDQLRRDEQQVQEIAPRLQPNVVDRLQQGLELTRQRLAQRRQQLLQQQPPLDPLAAVTPDPAAGRAVPPAPVIVAWPGT